MSFFLNLEARAREIDSLLCVGLDPHSSDLPEQSAEAARDFCFRLIEATSDLAAAYKPNSAFFEVYGGAGMDALMEVIAAVPEGIPLILDAKRGDIASTAQAYARAVFHTLGADAVTINPYLGYDAIEPYIGETEKGIFLLCKTSNPGADDLQELALLPLDVPGQKVAAGSKLFEQVARLAQSWNKSNNIGLVVGATQVPALARVRSSAPDLWILAPGVGAQGAGLAAAFAAGKRPDGMGILFPVSRAISRSKDPRGAAEDILVEIRRVQSSGKVQLSIPKYQVVQNDLVALAEGLLKAGCVKFGQFTLKSGLKSPIYIDLRHLVGYPSLLVQVAEAYLPILLSLEFNCLGALPYAALPIVTTISVIGGWPMIYPRKETKSYGTQAIVEGDYQAGEQVVVIDDLATTGGSKFEGIEKLTAVGLQVRDVVVLIDRQSGAEQALTKAGCEMHSVFTLTQLLDYWESNGSVPGDQIAAARRFLADTASD